MSPAASLPPPSPSLVAPRPAADRPVPPVLLRVPALRPDGGAGRRRPVPLRTARRRRLRREVRLGGAALLMVGVPVLLAGLGLGDPRRLIAPDDPAAAVADAEPPPAVLLSPELVPAPFPGEAMPQVRASGYLLPELPDEDAEEPLHAGT